MVKHAGSSSLQRECFVAKTPLLLNFSQDSIFFACHSPLANQSKMIWRV